MLSALPCRMAALAAAVLGAAACAGPREGILGTARGRTHLLAEEEERAPAPVPDGPGIHAFPFLFSEETAGRKSLEVLWPLFETGRAAGIGGSRYSYVRPILFSSRFAGREALVVFPFYWRIREDRESGPRSVDHLWPLYGRHRETIDLIPTETHHVLFPVLALRLGPGAWKARILPVIAVGSGFLDRGWWIFPFVKAGAGRGGWAGGNRFLAILDPLLRYERFSIAEPGRPEGDDETRTEVEFLGGFLGWERADGRIRIRLLWIRL